MSETSKDYVKRLIKKALEKQGFNIEPELTIPESEFGDYATSSVLGLAKKKKQNPKTLSINVAEEIKVLDILGSVEVETAGPGFINFRLSQQALLENLVAILAVKDAFGSSTIGKGQKILVEYFQPNIAKPLHLGHLRTAIIGDCLFRLFKFTGFSPQSDTHMGDWGTQFGILIAAYKALGNRQQVEKDPVNELNKLYVEMNQRIERKPELLEKGKEEFVKLEQGDEENRRLWKKFKDWSSKEFDVVYKELGIRKADHDWPESYFEDKMPQVLEELKSKGLLKESEGAQVVELNDYKLGVALVVKSDGGTTYLLRDLATLIYRKKQAFTKQYYVVDVRQSHTLRQTFKIVELLGHIQPGEAVHVAYGFLTLPEGAMSSRKGTGVGAKEFIKNVQQCALEVIEEKNPDLPEKDKVAKMVAIAAIKYFDLSHSIKSDIVFDPKKAISFEGNTGPYLQYTYARIHGILRRVQGIGYRAQSPPPHPSPLTPYELSVMRKLHQFPEIVEASAEDLQPNVICNYLFELSQALNAFYQEVPVLQEKDDVLRSFRLNLITATAQVIKNGLNLLGIEAPEEM